MSKKDNDMFKGWSNEKLIEALEKSQMRVTHLTNELHKTQMRVNLLEPKARKGDDFDVLLKATKDNAIVKGCWDRFVMSLRITGDDGSK